MKPDSQSAEGYLLIGLGCKQETTTTIGIHRIQIRGGSSREAVTVTVLISGEEQAPPSKRRT